MTNQTNPTAKAVQAQLEEWDAELQKLRARSKKAEAHLQEDYENRIRELESMYADIQKRIETMAEASEDEWENLKQDVGRKWEAFLQSVETTIGKS